MVEIDTTSMAGSSGLETQRINIYAGEFEGGWTQGGLGGALGVWCAPRLGWVTWFDPCKVKFLSKLGLSGLCEKPSGRAKAR
jgi:hypothetical protein